MPSQEQTTKKRYEYFIMARETARTQFPDSFRQLITLFDQMNAEGHLEIWTHNERYPCRIIRNHMGSWCGYVGVPYGHPCWGMHYDEPDVSVHGGLTFAHKVHDWGKDNFWFLGFDTAHGFDLNLMNCAYEMGRFKDITYKTKEYACNETTQLAEQLEKIEKEKK